MKKADFEYILKLLKSFAGWEFSDETFFVIDKKVDAFLREKGYSRAEDLVADLKGGNKALLWQVVEAMAMSDTCFFRDYSVFLGFENVVLPTLFEQNKNSKKLRIWSLGCSTGQETYSIAMIIKNKIKDFKSWNLDILGTDISTPSISKAQKGLYNSFEIQNGMPARFMVENFKQDRGVWEANRELVNMTEFRRYNLLEELTFPGNFDVIFCRNVLRFFDKENQKKTIENIFAHQNPDSYLYLGWGERVESLKDYYEPVKGMKCLFKAKAKVSRAQNAPLQKKGDVPSFVKPKNLL